MGNTAEQPRKRNGRWERSLKTAERDARAARLRMQSKTYAQIAEELGISVSEAYRCVERVLKRTIQEPGEQLLKMELQKLDMMEQRAHAVITRRRRKLLLSKHKEDYLEDTTILRANAQLLKIHESRRRLLGLDAPVKTEVTAGVTYEVVGVDMDDLK